MFYLIAGDNAALLSRQLSDTVKKLIIPEETDVTYVTDKDNLSLLLGIESLFSSRRIFVFRAAPSSDHLKVIAEYCTEPNDDTFIVLAVPRATVPLKKLLVAANGILQETEQKSYKSTANLLLNQSKVTLSPAARAMISEHVGQEIERIPSILDVLEASYSEGSVIQPDDLLVALGEKGGVPVWELLDAIDAANVASALRIFTRLTVTQAPIATLAAISSHMERMFRLQQAEIKTEKDAADFLGMKGSTYPAKKALNTLRRYGSSLPALAKLVANANTATKGGSPLPARMILEVLIGRLCTYPRR